ncbi:MAG: hemerythrin domain-containing protein [Rhodospirillales bacterium]
MTHPQDIGALLHQDHLHTLAIVNAVEARIMTDRERPLDRGDAEDARFIDELLDSIDRDIYRHFRFEEEELFPRVDKAGLGEVTAMLLDEHATIRAMADELAALARTARTAGPPRLDQRQWTQFRELAMDFIHAAMFHIQKEEMGIIRGLGMTLGTDGSRELAERYAAFQNDARAAP